MWIFLYKWATNLYFLFVDLPSKEEFKIKCIYYFSFSYPRKTVHITMQLISYMKFLTRSFNILMFFFNCAGFWAEVIRSRWILDSNYLSIYSLSIYLSIYRLNNVTQSSASLSSQTVALFPALKLGWFIFIGFSGYIFPTVIYKFVSLIREGKETCLQIYNRDLSFIDWKN